MEASLLKLYQSCPSGKVKQKDIADTLQLSAKQTSRLLHKWRSEGWIRFTPGKGRGVQSSLEWLRSVEAIYEKEMEQVLKNQSVQDAAKYLLYDWSAGAKRRLTKIFQTKFGYEQDGIDKLIIPKRNPFLTFYPTEAVDAQSANLVSNLYNRLVHVDLNGEVTAELAHSWEQNSKRLRVYLKKDVYFHDGSILTAEDVVHCFNKVCHHPSYKKIWSPIHSIVSPAPLVVDLYTTCSYFLQLLGLLSASIYKETNGYLYGTGSFYLEEDSASITVLKAFTDYFQERPLLDTIEFVQVPKDFDTIYRTSQNGDTLDTIDVQSDSGFGIVILNICHGSSIQNLELRHFIHALIAKHRNEIEGLNKMHHHYSANHNGFLIGYSQPYTVPQAICPKVTKPLIMEFVNYTEDITMWLKDLLEQAGIPVELRYLSFEEHLNNRCLTNDADIIVHGEIFEMNQQLSFFHFMTSDNSAVSDVVNAHPSVARLIQHYAKTPFEEWTKLNIQIERQCIDQSILIPLYYEKRIIPFSTDIQNVTIKHFGYVDFSKLWMKPNIL
ncbi:SgrR family transcriptional regulator [Viridibacillus sp. YIM B01967]|uniref:SgrR family transcriptional regulator n=1 Tax=Viridibacillus soli TaxID=2798301 RepID=A0ABS1H779_9BACL|nr:ABC transporter substrate-binding protein [Viridibacillus soli]MBK3495274.1 SgrR family transcriptional regulator [Viridibacillus soli]